MTRVPGALTVLPSGVFAAMLRLSFPPSMATPTAIIKSAIDFAASKRAAPSLGSFAAHIQFALHFASLRELILTPTMLVIASATAKRAIAEGFSNPFTGCSPIDEAMPTLSK